MAKRKQGCCCCCHLRIECQLIWFNLWHSMRLTERERERERERGLLERKEVEVESIQFSSDTKERHFLRSQVLTRVVFFGLKRKSSYFCCDLISFKWKKGWFEKCNQGSFLQINWGKLELRMEKEWKRVACSERERERERENRLQKHIFLKPILKLLVTRHPSDYVSLLVRSAVHRMSLPL